MVRLLLLLSVALAVALVSCSKPQESVPPPTAATPSQPVVPVDACTLLTSAEIEAVTGEAVTETRNERQTSDGLVISQCNFVLPTAANLINLRVIERGEGAGARDPKNVWQETFARDLEKAMRERKDAPPVKVAALGDDAFWLGGPKLGGLYVLKGNRYLRIGVGGEPNQEQKIETATKLARAALERLPAE